MATTIETSGEKHSYLFFVPISHIPLDQQISVSFPFGIPPTKISGKAGIFEPAWFLPRNLQAKLIGMMQVWATEFRCLKRFSHLCEKDSSKFGLIFSQQTGVNVAHVWTEKKIYNIYIYIQAVNYEGFARLAFIVWWVHSPKKITWCTARTYWSFMVQSRCFTLSSWPYPLSCTAAARYVAFIHNYPSNTHSF